MPGRKLRNVSHTCDEGFLLRPVSLPCGHTSWCRCGNTPKDSRLELESAAHDCAECQPLTTTCKPVENATKENSMSLRKFSLIPRNDKRIAEHAVPDRSTGDCVGKNDGYRASRWHCAECGWLSSDMGENFRPAAVDKLLEKYTNHNELSLDAELPTCAICCEGLCEPVSLPCGHTFDKKCLQSAMLRSNCCPLCRLVLPVDMPLEENEALTSVLKAINPEEWQYRKTEMAAADDFIYAATSGNSEAIHRCLSSHNLDDDAISEALISAAAKGHKQIVSTIIETGLVGKSARTTALSLAVKNKHTSIISAVAQGADLDFEEGGETVLFTSIRMAYIEACRILIKCGSSIERRGLGGSTPLIVACEGGHKEIVAMLLQEDAAVDNEDDSGTTALIAAASAGNEDIVSMLLDANADVNCKDDDDLTPLMAAAEEGHLKCMKILINRGAIVDDVNDSDETALMLCSRFGNVDAIRVLLEAEADVDLNRPDGATALFCAALAGQSESVEILIDEGHAKIETPLENGVTPLIAAVFTQHKTCVQAMLAREGVDVNRADNGGATSLTYAVMLGDSSITELLIHAGADIECRLKNGTTPLIVAAEHGHLSIVQLLLAAGANTKTVNLDGFSALEVAKLKNHKDTIAILM